MKKLIYILLLAVSVQMTAKANNLQITNVVASGNNLTFEVNWENSWRYGDDMYDAVWIFIKARSNGSQQWNHADITSANTMYPLEVITTSDQKGVYLRQATDNVGHVMTTMVNIEINTTGLVYPDFKVFGIEMVYVPEGAFYVGDQSSTNTLGAYDTTSQVVQGSFFIDSSDEILCGEQHGYLWANNGSPNVNIPATFPNGYDSFYCMKYEITQQQYIAFLNCLTREQQNTRTFADISGTIPSSVQVMAINGWLTEGNSIVCESILPEFGPIQFYADFNNNQIYNENGDGQNKAMNNIGRDDMWAFFDWTCLSPMTELQYEKACRGPQIPIAGEFAWGTPTLTPVSGLNNNGFPDEAPQNQGEAGLCMAYIDNTSDYFMVSRVGMMGFSGSSRIQAGASYYGMMDMTGNLAERTINIHSTDNLQFLGDNGDGNLAINGDANNFLNGNGNLLRTTQKGGGYKDNPFSLGYYEVSGRQSANSSSDGRNSGIGGRGVRSENPPQ